MVIYFRCRLFTNCLVTYLFIYIDVVIPESGTGPLGNRKWMLIIIGFCGTIQFFIKACLAIYYHWQWMLTDCRCWSDKPMYEDRVPHVNRYWKKMTDDYIALTGRK